MHAKGEVDSESGRFVTGVKCCRVAHSINFTKTLCVFLLLKSQDCNPNVNNYPCFKNRNNTFQLVSISFHNHAVIITNLYVVVTHPEIGIQVEVCEETVSILARRLSPLAYSFVLSGVMQPIVQHEVLLMRDRTQKCQGQIQTIPTTLA